MSLVYIPKVVVIGGGTGLPVVLRGLKKEKVDITAIVTVADDGGSSGKLRKMMHMAPPGDLRNVLVALSELEEEWKQIFQYRFKDGLENHALGNLIIAALNDMQGGIDQAVQTLSRLMKIKGHVYPAADESLTLHAVFADQTILSGETTITKHRKTIKEIYVTRSENDSLPTPCPEVIPAIQEADMIVLGPGSLFTSILPNLMITEIGQAVLEAKAQKVYICNIMTQKGETEHLSDAEHVRILHHHLHQRFIDTVLVNIEEVPENAMNQQRYDEYLVQVSHDFNGLREEGCRVISDDFLCLRDEGVFHNEDKVVAELMNLLSSWPHQ